MEKWLRNNFVIEKDVDDIEFIVFEYKNKTIKIALSSLTKYNLVTPITLEKLKSIDVENKIGWHKYFDDWKEQGILN